MSTLQYVIDVSEQSVGNSSRVDWNTLQDFVQELFVTLGQYHPKLIVVDAHHCHPDGSMESIYRFYLYSNLHIDPRDLSIALDYVRNALNLRMEVMPYE
jgi:endo-beta-N-acetylglucosaminidase D